MEEASINETNFDEYQVKSIHYVKRDSPNQEFEVNIEMRRPLIYDNNHFVIGYGEWEITKYDISNTHG